MAIRARVKGSGSPTPRKVEDVQRALRELGPSIAASFAPVIANLQATIIATIQATYSTTQQMNAAITGAIGSALSAYWTSSQTASHISDAVASPGAIAPTTVTASGQVSGTQAVFPTGVRSTGARNNQVTTGYVAAYIDQNGNLGFAPSTLSSKNIVGPYAVDMAAFLNVALYQYTYKSDPNKTMRMGPVADYLDAAGLKEFVVYATDGTIQGIRFETLVFGLWSAYVQSRTSTLARIAKQAHQTVTVTSMSALSLGGTAQYKVVWPAPFADGDYLVTASVYSTGGLPITGATAAVLQASKTATGCTVQVNAGVIIAAGQTLTVEAIHV